MDLPAILLEKKKKANELNKQFPKATKTAANNKRQMPMRKSGRGK